jgi:hypothetical protein
VPDVRAPAHELAIECGDDDPAGTAFHPCSFVLFDAEATVLLEAASGRTCVESIRHHAILGRPTIVAVPVPPKLRAVLAEEETE